MKTDNVIKKLNKMIRRIEADISPLVFCAMFIKEQADKWDFVVSATWLLSTHRESFETIAKELRGTLTSKELEHLSRVVILDKGSIVLGSFLREFSRTSGYVDMNYVSNDSLVNKAYIFVVNTIKSASRRESPKKRAGPSVSKVRRPSLVGQNR